MKELPELPVREGFQLFRFTELDGIWHPQGEVVQIDGEKWLAIPIRRERPERAHAAAVWERQQRELEMATQAEALSAFNSAGGTAKAKKLRNANAERDAAIVSAFDAISALNGDLSFTAVCDRICGRFGLSGRAVQNIIRAAKKPA